MFCNKSCDKCNHLKELIVEIDNKPQTIKKCVFEAILDSLLRQEQGDIRIQASIESCRNEQVKQSQEMNNIIANGFLSLVSSVDESKKEYIEYKEVNKH